MRLGIYGRKVGMTQIFDDNGGTVPITVIDTTGCVVTQVKTKASEGYNAIQVGFGKRKPQNVGKAAAGHFKKAGVEAKARVKEIRFEETTDLSQVKTGQVLTPSMFTKGDRVDVSGITKGYGFTGVMKRYGWSGKDATHGTSKYFRHGGSNGTNTFPGRVLKNHGMPGQWGNRLRTAQNLEVVDVRPEQNLILLRGAVPGPKQGMLLIRSTKKKKAPEGRTMVQA